MEWMVFDIFDKPSAFTLLLLPMLPGTIKNNIVNKYC